MTTAGRVFIIGAGPGSPGLITARGAHLLSEADVVVYDRDAEGSLRWARPDAERIAAAGTVGEHVELQEAHGVWSRHRGNRGYSAARDSNRVETIKRQGNK